MLRTAPSLRALARTAAAAAAPSSRASRPAAALSRGAARAFAAKPDAPNLVPEVKPGVAGEIPSIFDQATGLERAEIEHPDLFKHNEVLRGPFGTEDNPVKIQSNYDARIVGCTGKATPDDHDLVWLSVEKGQACTCDECGQVFELDPL